MSEQEKSENPCGLDAPARKDKKDFVRKASETNNSRIALGAACLAVYAVMLVLNGLTPYVADDYVYMFSFYDHKPLTEVGFFGIFKSMYKHAFRMNGRVISHGFEQIFMLFPKTVFNVINAAAFVLFIYVVYRIVNYGNKRSCVAYLCVAAAVWCFTPAFGQVYLWQVGSVNYLWGILFGLLYLLPFIFKFIRGEELLKRNAARAAFCVLSCAVGFYNEITSFIVIVFAAVMLAADWGLNGNKRPDRLYVAELFAAVGYILLLMMPAETAAKQTEPEVGRLLTNFREIIGLWVKHMLPVAVVWAAAFAVGCAEKLDKKRLILSLCFACGSVCASGMLIIAKYIPERCMITTAVFGIIAAGIPISELAKTKKCIAAVCGGILAVVFAAAFAYGSADILNSRRQVSEREAYIEKMKEQGNTELTLRTIKYATKYSPFYDLVDLQTETSDTWPNKQMAYYYGVDSILGEAEE